MQRLACRSSSSVSSGVTARQIPYLRTSRAFPVGFVIAATPRSTRHFASETKDKGAEETGHETIGPDHVEGDVSPFRFLTGYGLFAKRPSRPFPPPFLSLPSGSFSDPLSTHDRSVDRRSQFEGEYIRGITNGDDALLAAERIVGVGDGVGAWAQKERGHAALWSRLILHFWALSAERSQFSNALKEQMPALQYYLQQAYESTKSAVSPPNEWFGTTTATAALVTANEDSTKPQLQITQLGDSKILVIRQSSGEVIYRTEEQWHWFDCPRQLGTNSPDTPKENAVTDTIECEEDDIVLAISDGVSDNLWEHEVVANVRDSISKEGEAVLGDAWGHDGKSKKAADAMRRIAGELVRASRVIAEDPFAESPFMERAVEEGLPTEGGKLDDISVVVALCKRRPTG